MEIQETRETVFRGDNVPLLLATASQFVQDVEEEDWKVNSLWASVTTEEGVPVVTLEISMEKS